MSNSPLTPLLNPAGQTLRQPRTFCPNKANLALFHFFAATDTRKNTRHSRATAPKLLIVEQFCWRVWSLAARVSSILARVYLIYARVGLFALLASLSLSFFKLLKKKKKEAVRMKTGRRVLQIRTILAGACFFSNTRQHAPPVSLFFNHLACWRVSGARFFENACGM